MLRRLFRRRPSNLSLATAARHAGIVEMLESRQLLSVSLISQGATNVPAATPGAGSDGQTTMNPSVSDDGRYVAFVSAAGNLVADDDNNAADIFVRDRQTGQTILVSAAPDNTVGNGKSGDPGAFRNGFAISGNGRFVVFASDATDLIEGKTDNNNLPDYFVRDLQTSTTQLVTATGSGDYSTASTFGGTNGTPAISDDGQFVTFTATFSDLDPAANDADGNQPDVFVRDLVGGTTTELSAKDGGGTGGGSVGANPTISSDGRFIAFTSNDTLVPGLDSSTFVFEQVWAHDNLAGVTTPVSLAADGATYGNSHSTDPRISGDGRSIVFLSSATNLTPDFQENNTPGADAPDVFLRKLVDAQTTVLVSHAADSANAGSNGENEDASISADGRFVVYQSEATNLVSGISDTNDAGDVFFFDSTSGQTKLLSINAAGNATGNQASVDLTGSSHVPLAISDSGQFVAFASAANDLVASDDNPTPELFIRNTQADTTRRVYEGIQLPGGADVIATGGAAAISGDGTTTAFVGSGFGIVGTDVDSIAPQVFADAAGDGNNGGGDGNNGGGDGNNGGGGTGGTLTPTIAATLPAAVVGGAKARGASAIVKVTNTASTDYNGSVAVTLFASTDNTLDTNADLQITSLTKKLKIAAGQSKDVKVKIASFPSAPDGDYVLIAQASGDNIAASTGATGNKVTIAAPFVDVASAFGSVSSTAKLGKKAKLALNLTNSGNVDAKGSAPVTIEFSTTPGGEPVVGGNTTAMAKLALKAGASKPAKLSFTVPAELPAGTYYVTTALDAGSLNDTNQANNTSTSTTTITVA
jgi:Tol biopolymer transport system component